jgi:nitroimidazol reductase NimA-like FMN-containing flavoprotein (pyridoxamine 5'-phosphate oxidase superfamily)
MLPAMEALLSRQGLCVLATAGPEGAHASLMSFLWEPEERRIYLVSSADTRKYQNLLAEPRVSLLIDDRRSADVSSIRALTVRGRCRPLEEGRAEAEVLARFAAEHPQLARICADPESRVLVVEVEHLQLLEGPAHQTNQEMG